MPQPITNAKPERDEDLLPPSLLHQLDRMRIIATKLYPGSRMGQRVSKAKGSGMEFSEHKPYSLGDDFRWIDWNVYARTDNLYLKTYETEMNLYVYIIVDISQSMRFGAAIRKLDYARQLAGALGYITLVQGDNLTVTSMNDELRDSISTSNRRLRPSDVLRFCRGLEPAGMTDFKHGLHSFSVNTGHPGMVFLISDFFSESKLADALRFLVYSGFDVTALHLIDPWEQHPELAGEVDMEDPETGELISVTVRSGTVDQIKKSFAAHCRGVNRAFALYKSRYFQVSTERAVERFLLEDMKHAGVIR